MDLKGGRSWPPSKLVIEIVTALELPQLRGGEEPGMGRIGELGVAVPVAEKRERAEEDRGGRGQGEGRAARARGREGGDG
uniref:Uncharacterized protein n=1 Tax=Leersia perrieri TaxID=77586 RepID=A0A0D9X5Z3_9ORYZ